MRLALLKGDRQTALLSSRVIFFIDLLELLAAHMCIYLCRDDLAVPEQELYRPEISSSFQEMGGERMAEHMRADFPIQVSLFAIPLQHFPDSLTGESSASVCQEKECVFLFHKFGPGILKISL